MSTPAPEFHPFPLWDQKLFLAVLPYEGQLAEGLWASCFPLGLSFHICQPGKSFYSLLFKETRMDMGQF